MTKSFNEWLNLRENITPAGLDEITKVLIRIRGELNQVANTLKTNDPSGQGAMWANETTKAIVQLFNQVENPINLAIKQYQQQQPAANQQVNQQQLSPQMQKQQTQLQQTQPTNAGMVQGVKSDAGVE